MEQETKLSQVYNANKASVQQKSIGFPYSRSSINNIFLMTVENWFLVNVPRSMSAERRRSSWTEEGLLEGLLRPDCADPVPSQLDSAFSRVIDNTELLDNLLHNLVLLVLLPLLHWL